MDREESKICAIDTVEAINLGFYSNGKRSINIFDDVKKMLERTKLYTTEELYITREKYKDDPRIIFSNKTTTEAAKNLYDRYKKNHYKVGVLNFASAKHPGGGFLRGAMAQEESIARVSTLYASLCSQPDFYNHNLSVKTSLYTDYIIYSENVTVFKDDDGNPLMVPYNIDVITSPAPNVGAIEKYEPHNLPKVYSVMENRIRKIIKIAILNNIDCLVLGAFGCGVFKNKMEDVAKIFSEILIDEGFANYFKVIEFAIYDRDPKKYIEFEDVFYG